jgi:hypothetical protein
VLANFSGSSVTFDLPDPVAWTEAELVLGNYDAPPALGPTTTLRPWEAHVHRVRRTC